MVDIIDKAQEAEDAFLRSALSKRPEGPKATGFCLCCGEELPSEPNPLKLPPRRWCDALCRDEWQAENPEPQRPGSEYIAESATPPEEIEPDDEERDIDGC